MDYHFIFICRYYSILKHWSHLNRLFESLPRNADESLTCCFISDHLNHLLLATSYFQIPAFKIAIIVKRFYLWTIFLNRHYRFHLFASISNWWNFLLYSAMHFVNSSKSGFYSHSMPVVVSPHFYFFQANLSQSDWDFGFFARFFLLPNRLSFLS